MKKWIILGIILLIIAGAVYFLFGDGILRLIRIQTYETWICENGIYYKYPKGVVDANATYYDKNGNILGGCGFFNSFEESCKKITEQAGRCQKK